MIRALIAAHPMAFVIAVVWLLMTAAIVVAGWRNAFDADRSEQEIEVVKDRMTLARYRERAIPDRATAGTPAKELPAALSNLKEGI